MLQSVVDEIKKNLIYVLDEVVHSRQYLNKHFQNSMNNYFLENYATLPCLKKRFDTQSGRQVRKEIFEKYNSIQEVEGKTEGNLKCFLIMRGFIEEHKQNNSIKDYRQSLISIINASTSDNSIKQGSSEWISLQWRRLFALMVLHHTYYPEIQGVYELWFHVFDERLIARERQKKKKEEIIYKKGKTPYIITSKVEENDQSTSPLPKENGMNTSLIVRVNEGSLSSITSNDEQHTQCSIESPKSPPSLLNIGKKQDSINEKGLKKSQVKIEKDSENEEGDEPALQKKRFTQDTIVLLKDRSISQANTRSSISSHSSVILNNNLGSEQTIDTNQKMQKVNFSNQSQQEQLTQSQQQVQQQLQQQSLTSTPFSSNYLQPENSNQNAFYQTNCSLNNVHQGFSSIENKQEDNTSYANIHQQNTQYYNNDPIHYHPTHQYAQPGYSQHHTAQSNQCEQSYQQMCRQSSYAYQSSSSLLERQQSGNYPYEENSYAYNYAQQPVNQSLIGQIQNNQGVEPQADYFMNCNQENYMNSQYEHQNNDEFNKLKFETQSMPYTSHNLDMQNQYQLQYKGGDQNIHNQQQGQSNRYNSIQQYNQPMNYRPYQQQQQGTSHIMVKQNYQQSQYFYPPQNGIHSNYEYNPYESSYSTCADPQSEYCQNSSTPSSASSSFSSFNSPVANSEQQQFMQYNNVHYKNGYHNQSSFCSKVEDDLGDTTQFQYQNYQYQQPSFMNQYPERNYVSMETNQDIFSTLKNEQI